MICVVILLFLVVGTTRKISNLDNRAEDMENLATTNPKLEESLKKFRTEMKNLGDALKKLEELQQMEDKLRNAFPEGKLQFEFSGFNNRPSATGEEDEDWIVNTGDTKNNLAAIHPKFPTVPGTGVVAVVWKYGFDLKLLQGLSSGQVMKSSNAWSAKEFCAGQGYSLISFDNIEPYSEVDYKEEISHFVEWFYPGMTRDTEGKLVLNLKGNNTGRISARTECISLVYGRLVETEEQVVEKTWANSSMVHVEEGHVFNCCK